jgi:hypothetical protein
MNHYNLDFDNSSAVTRPSHEILHQQQIYKKPVNVIHPDMIFPIRLTPISHR